MANNLNAELTGKYVILELTWFRDREAFKAPVSRMFKCEDGFGCSPNAWGTAIFGHFCIDGEKARVKGYDIERFATEEEIKQAKYP